MTPLAIVGIIIASTACIALFIILGVAIWKHQGGHKHAGTETGRRYMPGIMEQGGTVKGFVSDDILYGYTEISYKCDTCGKRFINRYVGKLID